MNIYLRVLKDARKYWKYLIIAMFALVGITVAQLYGPWVVRRLTNLAVDGSPDIAEQAVSMGLRLLIVYILQACCTYLRSYYTHVAAWNYVADLRTRLYAKLQQLSLKYYNDKQTGQLMSRVISDTSDIELLIAHAAPDLIVNIMIFFSVGVMLFSINAKLAAASLITIPFLLVASRFFSKVVLPKFRLRQKVLGELSGTLQDNITGMKEIQVFNQQQREELHVGGLAHEHARLTLAALRNSAVYHPMVQFLSSFGNVVVIIYGGIMAASGLVPIADIVAFMLYLGTFYTPITTLARVNEDLQTARASAERIFEVLDEESDVKEKDNARTIGRAEGGVEFNHVSFSYTGSIPVLMDINLKIAPGEIVALVGPTGVGKTTMVSLLNRFYDPSQGEILLDGNDISELTLSSLRDNISIVLQDVFLFTGTVAENIAYSVGGNATMEQIIEAAKTARAHDFIMELEDGYNTCIGERGVRLSGGQKQRLSIARAVLRNRPILVLDEATASVDVETEQLIQEAMDVVMQGRTTILIAHRLSTVKKADKIVVLNEGKIEEVGRHEQLLQRGGLYSHLAMIQRS